MLFLLRQSLFMLSASERKSYDETFQGSGAYEAFDHRQNELEQSIFSFRGKARQRIGQVRAVYSCCWHQPSDTIREAGQVCTFSVSCESSFPILALLEMASQQICNEQG